MNKEAKRYTASVEMQVSAEDFVQSLSHEELVAFIKELDEAAQDWGVTLALCEHFAALKIEHALEEAADAMAVAAHDKETK